MKKFYLILLTLLNLLVLSRFYILHYQKHEYYYEKYLLATENIVYGLNAPRGRILDRNGKVLVDNVGINTIVFHDLNHSDTLEMAKILLDIIPDTEVATLNEQKSFYLQQNDTDNLLTEKEQELYSHRKLTTEEVTNIKFSRIDNFLNYTEEEQQLIHLYTLLNKGYSYDPKIIESDVNDEICARVNSLNIDGLSCTYTTKRVYLYDTLNAIYGKVGSINLEDKEYYLDKGYSLNDEVGLSYLEKQYDEYLRGQKAKYQVQDDNTLVLLSEAQAGSDIFLSIDIDLQLQVNEVIKKNLTRATTMRDTKYFNSAYVIVSDPNTGEIIASSGLTKIKDSFHDVTTNILTNSFIVGSVIKGASHTVGYQNDLIDAGKKINDSCVKLYQVPLKCSHRKLGYIDDITALKTSSNYYQFMTAIKLTNHKYKYNMKLEVDETPFNIYRDTFASFGLGSSTGIDLDNEFLGIKGSKISADLLLNFSIGQYDTYTPLQITNYINTIATSGQRYALHYLKEVKNNDETIYTYEPQLLNTVESNFPRIKKGFKEVMTGTGAGYTDEKYNPAGKTGTAQVVYSKSVQTINSSYAMFAPYDNPKYSIVVITPNISYISGDNNYLAPINRYISQEISKIVFEN